MRDIDIINTYNDMLLAAEDADLVIDIDLGFGTITIREAGKSQCRYFKDVREARAYILGYLDKTKAV